MVEAESIEEAQSEQEVYYRDQNSEKSEIKQEEKSICSSTHTTGSKNSNEDFGASASFQLIRNQEQQGKSKPVGKGRWREEEHLRFLQAIRLYGKDWRKVEDFIGTRSAAQIRSHA